MSSKPKKGSWFLCIRLVALSLSASLVFAKPLDMVMCPGSVTSGAVMVSFGVNMASGWTLEASWERS